MALDVLQVTLVGVANGQRVANVMHFESAVEDSPDPLALALDFATAWHLPGGGRELYLDCLPDSYGYIGARIRRINNTGGPTYTRTDLDAGTRAGSADFSGAGPVGLVHSNAGGGAVEWHTGKIFFPSVSIDDVSNNIFVDALKAAIIAFIQTLMDGIGIGPNGPFKLGVYNRTANVFRPGLGNSVSGKVGTQRRRYIPI